VEPLIEKVHPQTGRLHTTFHQTGTATGRLASSDPNLQNIPARSDWGLRIRRAFVARGPEWCLLSADYSQIELRILAHITGDATLTGAFARGEDIHTRTACEVFDVAPEEVSSDQRRMAKVVNFGLIYGMNEYGLAQRLEITPEEAQRYIEKYFARFPGVQAYTERVVEEARRRGYTETLFGRRRYLPALHSSETREREAAERAAINTPIQGSAADLIKKAMIQVVEALEGAGSRALLLLQIHDELLFEVPREESEEVGRMVKEVMTSVYPLRVPLEVHLARGPNWCDLEPFSV
jgi:DNA polymerase-1